MFIKGADVSNLPFIEKHGGCFRDGGVPKDGLQLMKEYGINYIRLRIWNDPPNGYCGKAQTLAFAKRVKEASFKLLLDFHYSDVWADPDHQFKPAAWKELAFEELVDALYAYTLDIVASLHAQGTPPDMVQIGNEIAPGMLWDDGKVTGEFDTEEQWAKLAECVKAGVRGVRDGSKSDGCATTTMVHIDFGGNNTGCVNFYDNLLRHSVEFDLIGLSFYPWSHGTLDDLRLNMHDLAERYAKGIVVVEIAHPFTLENSDGVANMVKDVGQLHPGYQATPAEQHRYLTDLMSVVVDVPGGKGLGVFYWEPDWFSLRTFVRKPKGGNNWENQALFDFDGNALEGWKAFREFSRKGL
ncbi:glycosyl hydrolase 53 family protein [Paenibacillus sp. V4I7]|uniref:glycoside hydrolase family 53 protein n=1 Tax=Paenibacillus sp. V4I7 TaxID=3042307 RepID=UPI00278414A1|nr:glycosyl hydrolase 53 family protein [Paenibacillus sp. V4I7]MDQ0900982.1 arabinogalactan endo-1,4-beta-galactosidase [Paenibacillus sp. V4I7]